MRRKPIVLIIAIFAVVATAESLITWSYTRSARIAEEKEILDQQFAERAAELRRAIQMQGQVHVRYDVRYTVD